MKKILIISPFNIFPPYSGSANRIYNLVKYLSRKNRVFLLCNNYKRISSDENKSEYVSNLSNTVLYFVRSFKKLSQIINPLLLLEGLKIIKAYRPDYIIAEFTWSGLHAILLHFLTGVPYILDEHNVEFLRFARIKRGNKLSIFLLKQYENLSCIFAHKIFCVSEVDRNLLIQKLNIDKNKIIIVPNGIDIDKICRNEGKKEIIRNELNIKANEKIILFYGTLDYKPNLEAVEIIYKEILPRIINKMPNTKFLVVGNNPPLKYKHNSIIFTGVVDNLIDYINISDLMICPLTSGGGTRIKILESIACGRCVISTSIGAEGLVNTETAPFLEIIDDWHEFADKIIDLLKEQKGQKAPSVSFLRKYSWRNIVTKALKLVGNDE